MVCKLNNGGFVQVSESDEGWMWSHYGSDFRLVDGGLLTDPDMDEMDALQEAVVGIGVIDESFVEVDEEWFVEQVDD